MTEAHGCQNDGGLSFVKNGVGGMGGANKCAAAGLSHAFNGVSDHPRCAQDAMQD